jgi:hypothetical protein
MFTPAPDPPRARYYFAIAVFVAVLAFAVLGLVRVSSLVGPAPARPGATPRPFSTRTVIVGLPVPTAQIPPPTPSEPTRPPSVTYLYPPPEESVTAAPDAGTQPRR